MEDAVGFEHVMHWTKAMIIDVSLDRTIESRCQCNRFAADERALKSLI